MLKRLISQMNYKIFPIKIVIFYDKNSFYSQEDNKRWIYIYTHTRDFDKIESLWKDLDYVCTHLFHSHVLS